jgi:hypothetical protein
MIPAIRDYLGTLMRAQLHLVQLGRRLIDSQSNAAVAGRRMSVIGGIADIRGFWPTMFVRL